VPASHFPNIRIAICRGERGWLGINSDPTPFLSPTFSADSMLFGIPRKGPFSCRVLAFGVPDHRDFPNDVSGFTAPEVAGFSVQGHTERAWSGGTAALSNAALSRATLTFSGTGVSWLGLRGPQAGVAKVYLDGAYQVDMDCYASRETVRAVLFTRSGLTADLHILTIDPTGTMNPAATDAFIVVDAFDVTP